jgi:hypothetical protein
MTQVEPRTSEMNDEEFHAVSALPPGERYNHFVKHHGFIVPPEGMKEDIESELSVYELSEG